MTYQEAVMMSKDRGFGPEAVAQEESFPHPSLGFLSGSESCSIGMPWHCIAQGVGYCQHRGTQLSEPELAKLPLEFGVGAGGVKKGVRE